MQNRISVSGLSQEEAEGLVEEVWQGMLKGVEDILGPAAEYEHASAMLADVDGDGREEAVVAVSSPVFGPGIVAVFQKRGEHYDLWKQIFPGSSVGVSTVDLFGDGRQALVIGSLTGGAKWGRNKIRVYRWKEDEFATIWEGSTWENGFSMHYKYNARVEVQFADLNRDGVQEIIRTGVVYRGEWEELPGLGEAELPEFGIEAKLFPRELRSPGPDMNFARITSGYEAVYRFRQTFFYDREFDYYIQYKARVVQDKESISAGTIVGVLGTLSEAYISVLSLESSIHVVLPDSRVDVLPRGVLERIHDQ